MGSIENIQNFLNKGNSASNQTQSALNQAGGLLRAADQSFADIILEAAGLTIPLPSQIEVNNFFIKRATGLKFIYLKCPFSGATKGEGG